MSKTIPADEVTSGAVAESVYFFECSNAKANTGTQTWIQRQSYFNPVWLSWSRHPKLSMYANASQGATLSSSFLLALTLAWLESCPWGLYHCTGQLKSTGPWKLSLPLDCYHLSHPAQPLINYQLGWNCVGCHWVALCSQWNDCGGKGAWRPPVSRGC